MPSAVLAYRDDASVSIVIAFGAGHRPTADLSAERPGGALPAGPAFASGKTALRALGGIDSVQTHPHGADFYRIAVEHPCRADRSASNAAVHRLPAPQRASSTPSPAQPDIRRTTELVSSVARYRGPSGERARERPEQRHRAHEHD